MPCRVSESTNESSPTFYGSLLEPANPLYLNRVFPSIEFQKINGPGQFETVFCLLLLRMARMAWINTCSIFKCYVCKNQQKNVMVRAP